MAETTVYRRWAGGGWNWYVTDGDDVYDGYARTRLGARFAAWKLMRPSFRSWLSYAIRPYDSLADRRRWFFQRRQRCGFFR